MDSTKIIFTGSKYCTAYIQYIGRQSTITMTCTVRLLQFKKKIQLYMLEKIL